MMKWEAESKGYTCNDCFLYPMRAGKPTVSTVRMIARPLLIVDNVLTNIYKCDTIYS